MKNEEEEEEEEKEEEEESLPTRPCIALSEITSGDVVVYGLSGCGGEIRLRLAL